MPRRMPLLLILLLLPVAAAPQTPSILTIAFEGNSALNSARLRSEFRFCREGAPYRAELLRMDLKNVEALYQGEGFLQVQIGEPRIEAREDAVRGKIVAIRIPVAEGPQFLTGELTVRGASVFSTSALLQMAPLRSGQPYSRRAMEEWKDRIAQGYREMGYIRFELDLREQVGDFTRRVDCELDCREGSPYRVGRISIQSEPAVDPTEFKRRLLVGEGGPFNPEMLSLSLQFLNRVRMFRPISQSDVDIIIDDTTRTVDLVFRVTPLKKPS